MTDVLISAMMLQMSIDWDKQGTLHSRFGYMIRTDALWMLLTAACQGHEGDVEDMWITMADDSAYGPAEIRDLATHPERKQS